MPRNMTLLTILSWDRQPLRARRHGVTVFGTALSAIAGDLLIDIRTGRNGRQRWSGCCGLPGTRMSTTPIVCGIVRRCAGSSAPGRRRARRHPADTGDGRANQGPLTDQPEGEADQGQREGGSKGPLCRLTDGRSCRAEDAVRRDPAADRRVAATLAAAPGKKSIVSYDRWQPVGRNVSMAAELSGNLPKVRA